MKTLSFLVLIGTATALLLGGILAVTPVFADNSSAQPVDGIQAAAAPELASAPALAPSIAPVAIELEVNMAPEAAVDPGLVLANTFSLAVAKDTSGAVEAQAVASAQANLADFVASVSNGKSSQVTGIYVDDAFAYNVGGQNGNASFVTTNPGEVTQFGLAAQYGTQGFLAHNYLAGAAFSQLEAGQLITLVYGDGSTEAFRIETLHRYQALSPDSTQSRFVDLSTGEELSVTKLFNTIYNNQNAVVLQTCIANDGVSTWGRLFVVAVPAGDDVVNDGAAGDENAQTGAVAVTGED